MLLNEIIPSLFLTKFIRLYCRKAIATGGKVLVVEMVLPKGNEPSIGKLLDLEMLLFLPGCERTESEYRALFDKAGLELSSNTDTITIQHS